MRRHARQIDIDETCAQSFESSKCGIHRAIDFGDEPLIKVRFWNSDPDAFDVARERLERTSVDYLKQDCDVFNRSRHRSRVIE